MKCLLVILLLITLNDSYSQIDESVIQKADQQTGHLMVRFTNGASALGCAIILNENFIVTCFHVYKPNASFKIAKMLMRYNISDTGYILTYDSVYIDLDYKSIKNQYDFTNHFYDSNSSGKKTDVVILKLEKKIKCQKATFTQTTPIFNDMIYSVGYVATPPNGVTKKVSVSRFVAPLVQDSVKFMTALGSVQAGYSGSPIYNSKGEILGMVQYGIDDIESFIKEIETQAPTGMIDAIRTGYKYYNEKLSVSISSQYLIKTYLAGYD